jgi:hypothetical protein
MTGAGDMTSIDPDDAALIEQAIAVSVFAMSALHAIGQACVTARRLDEPVAAFVENYRVASRHAAELPFLLVLDVNGGGEASRTKAGLRRLLDADETALASAANLGGILSPALDSIRIEALGVLATLLADSSARNLRN